MWHTVLIVVHAATATVALLAGLVSLPAGRLFGLYRWSLIGMLVALAPAVAIGWANQPDGTRIAYTGLLVLAVVMVVMAERARRDRPTTTVGGPTVRYLDRVGFTLIALSDGFAIVAAIRAGLPGWAVAVIGVGVVVVGHTALQVAKRRMVRPPAAVRAGSV
jgi:hypothetical protein